MLVFAIPCALSACGGGSSETDTVEPNTAILTWDAVMDSNLAGYRIYYGTSPRAYEQPFGQGVEVGNVTTFAVTGLNRGSRHYFAATAFDTSNNESALSNEVFKDMP